MFRSVSSAPRLICLALTITLGLHAAARAQSTEAHIIVDAHTKKIFGAANADRKVPVASLTKIATACVVLDWAEQNKINLGQRVAIPASAASLRPNPFQFAPGDTLSLRDALCCAMMGSDNIAAEALAVHVGADMQNRTGRGGTPYATFVKQMNTLGAYLRMRNTKFLNPHGLDNGRQVPLSTAADMARLSLYAIKLAPFTFYTSQKERRITVYRGGTRAEMFVLKNLNTALGRAGINGMKTGTTARAGQCLVLSAERKPHVARHGDDNATIFPRQLVVVLLGSQNRFPVGEGLLAQGWARYEQWHQEGRVIRSTEELLDPQ